MYVQHWEGSCHCGGSLDSGSSIGTYTSKVTDGGRNSATFSQEGKGV